MRRASVCPRSQALLVWVCVAAHCLSVAWLPALLSAGAALVGNDHLIHLRWDGRHAAVVLRHSADRDDRHTHHVLTALLVSLSCPASPSCPDHVVEFGCSDEQLTAPRPAGAAPDWSASLPFALAPREALTTGGPTSFSPSLPLPSIPRCHAARARSLPLLI